MNDAFQVKPNFTRMWDDMRDEFAAGARNGFVYSGHQILDRMDAALAAMSIPTNPAEPDQLQAALTAIDKLAALIGSDMDTQLDRDEAFAAQNQAIAAVRALAAPQAKPAPNALKLSNLWHGISRLVEGAQAKPAPDGLPISARRIYGDEPISEQWSPEGAQAKPAAPKESAMNYRETDDECPGCGATACDRKSNKPKEPQGLQTCPRCGSEKCVMCDMGDDVECISCDLP